MKQNLLAGAALLLLCAATKIRAADDLPKQAAFARYEAMLSRSPFAVATATAPPPSAPNFAKDLYIANAARLSDETVATLTSGVDKNMKEYITTKGPNAHGWGISDVDWSDHVGGTKVTISKDGQFATLTFNQALITQPVAGVQPQPLPPPQTAQPGQVAAAVVPNNVGNQIKPAPIPTLPTPPPRVRGVIQRNPAGIKEQQAASAAAAGAVQEPPEKPLDNQ